uniref:Uncharacterized protein n=1 Tax=viral metagenome TaxID=1070528 RepID=A0A6C0JYF4_9ZZZZ
MDSKMFRLPTAPNFYNRDVPVDVRTHARQQSAGAPDSRFPGWPGPMSDGRLVTDYSAHCENNIPAGSQYATTRWMQRNADEIMNFARKRTAQTLGGSHPYDTSVVPPATEVFKCSKSECTRQSTGAPGAIGTERSEPLNFDLFGTYTLPQFPAPKKLVGGTTLEEGGRNTRR